MNDNKPDPATIETNRGYRDGREGKDYDDGSDLATQAITLGGSGQPREGAHENYGPAYKEGKKDREENK